MRPTPAELEAFRRDGFVVLPGVFLPERMAAALAALEPLFYGEPFATWEREQAAGRRPGTIADGIAPFADGRRSRWPTGHDALDALIEEATLLDVATALLDATPFFCNAHLFLRCGPTDQRFPADPWSGWHFDHLNHGLLPPADDPATHHYLNLAVHLADVDADCAPTLFLPGTQRRAVALAAAALADGNFDAGTFRDVRRLGDLGDPVAATGPVGSVTVASSYVLHAAQPFRDRRRQRPFWTLSVGRRDHASFCRYADPFLHGERDHLRPWLIRATPRLRTLLGWPPPGDPYYTPATLTLLERAYPGIGLAPYRAAMKPRGA